MSFKKIYILSLFCLFGCAFTFSEALSDVDISFCDDLSGNLQSGTIVSGSNLFYKIGVQQEGDICYTITNKSLQDAFLKISFVDGTFTNDQWKNKACLSDTDLEYFGQYVTGYDTILSVSGGQTLQRNAKFKYPSGSDGIYHGCLVYSIVNPISQDSGESANFAVLMRRAKFIDVFVGNPMIAGKNAIAFVDFSPSSGENLSSNPKIRIYIDPADGKYVLQFQLKNVSSLDQEVTITGGISNFIAYNKSFAEPRRLLRGESLLITKKFDEVPLYNMNVKLDLSYVPYYIFGDEKPEIGVLYEKTNVWIVDTLFIISIVGLVFVLIIVFLLVVVLRNQNKKNRISDKVK